jgi:hypothetical protein
MKLHARMTAAMFTTALLAVAGGGPASAADSISGATGASLIEKGAAVVVTVAFHCDAERSGSLSVRATQRTKQQQIVAGDGSVEILCGGGDEDSLVRVIVTPRNSTLHFQTGPAVLLIGLQTCVGPNECTSTDITTEVRFTNR